MSAQARSDFSATQRPHANRRGAIESTHFCVLEPPLAILCLPVARGARPVIDSGDCPSHMAEPLPPRDANGERDHGTHCI